MCDRRRILSESRRKRRYRQRLLLLAAAGVWLLIPADAVAWGPVVHLHCAAQLLSGAAAALSPSVLDLLRSCARDFMYGTLAADFVVGKKHAKDIEHCHNWDVARDLLRAAKEEGPEREAFMLGYINHLGADVVAHNHTVPQMTVIHYAAKGVGHIYWEARADWRILSLHPEIEELWATQGKLTFPAHDRFLWEHVVPTLFSHPVSAGIYRGNLVLQRNRVWKNLLSRIDRKSKLHFDQRQLMLWIHLASQSGARAMDNPWSKRLDQLDPIGAASLAWAADQRKKLRRELRMGGKGAVLSDLLDDALSHAKTVDIHHFEEDWI